MAVWVRNDADDTYSAEFPVAGGQRCRITVGEAEFADEEFAKGSGEFLPLREGRFYHYEISGGGRLSKASSFVRGGGGRTGRLAPGTAVGYGRLWLEGHTAPEEALGVEVVSDVIGYKDDYGRFLAQLAGYVADLQMQCAGESQFDVGIDAERSPETKIQEYFFLLGTVNDDGFERALRRIVENPYLRLEDEETERDIRRAARFGAAALRQVASSARRTAAPASLRGRIATLPERIAGIARRETADIPENRFVKHVLTTFRTRLREFKDDIHNGIVRPGKEKCYAIELDVEAGLKRLDRWLTTEFFRCVGPLVSMPTASVVLQRREGYRDLLRKWLQSQAAAAIALPVGADAIRENQKDTATLYEYWCFFRLLDIASDLFGIDMTEVVRKKMVGVGADGLSLKISEGSQLGPLPGRYIPRLANHRYRSLDVEFQYNRRFSLAAGKSSWTMMMIPDFTISFRPRGMSVKEAERLDLISYVHFDAKYKAKDIVRKMAEAEKAELEEASVERYAKREDLLKMHAYRDAIPRTAGAYILYPGTAARNYPYGDEILPGLGAFPLYPREDRSDDEPIKRFLASVAEYLCDRITRWENFTYQKNLAFSGTREEWGRRQAAVADRFRHAETVEDSTGGIRDNLSDRDRLANIPADRFLSVPLGAGPKGGPHSRDKQAAWIAHNAMFVKSTGRALDCHPEDLLMVTATWQPPFHMMVKRYEGKRTRDELESKSGPLPFPGSEFHVWDVSLHGFDRVSDYLKRKGLL